MLQDLRFALRLLLKDRWFTCVAVLALSLGIGVNTAVFNFVNAVLIRGLPFDRSEEIAFLATRNTTRDADDSSPASWTEFEEWRARARSFAGIAAFIAGPMNISDPEHPAERITGASVSANTFGLLRQQPFLGRDFAPGEDRVGATPVLILGYDTWRNRYGSDPKAIGRLLRINEVSYTVIGVMPKGMRFPTNADLWRPLLKPANPGVLRVRNVSVFARLGPGVGWRQAEAEMGAISTALQGAYPENTRNIEARLMTFNERFNGGRDKVVFLALLGATGFVLLIACANVANLLLARSASRARELAVRTALGASRGRIVRQLLMESLLFAVLGGGFGLMLAYAGVRLFERAVAMVPKPYWIVFTFDPAVFAYFAFICLTTVFVFGLAPALQGSKANPHALTKDGGRGTAGGARTRWLTSVLVVVELTLTLALLTGAGLMARSFLKLYALDVGIETDHVLTMRTQLVFAKYPKPEQRQAFFETLEQRIRAIPGVTGTAVTTALPLDDGGDFLFEIEGRPVADAASRPRLLAIEVSASYFDALGVPIRSGRALTSADGIPGAEVIVINQQLAAQLFAGDEPIGRRIRLMTGPKEDVPGPWMTIVGVSGTVRQGEVQALVPLAAIYRPYRVASPTGAAIAIRTAGDPAALTAAVREAARALDPDQPLYQIQPLNDILLQAQWPYRIFGSLFVIFALIALALSAVGIYAITAYAVTQRTPEIGVRLALGAQPGQIRWLILKTGLVQLTIGLTLGLIAARGVSFVLSSVVAQIPSTDPVTFAGITVLLVVVTLGACLIPAARATRLDPLASLRE